MKRLSLRTLLVAILILSAGLAASRAFFRGYPVLYTGRSMDISIRGAGYLMVADDETGELSYTRDGRLWIDSNSQLCVGERFPKYRLEPGCVVPMGIGELKISPEGMIAWADRAYPASPDICVGQLQLANFTNTRGMREIAPGFYSSDDQPWLSTPGEQGVGTVVRGWREMGHLTDDVYGIVFMPAILLSFVAGVLVGTACLRTQANAATPSAGELALPSLALRATTPPLPAPAGGA